MNTFPLTAGAEQQTAYSVLRQHLVSAISGPNTDALLYALAGSDEKNWENAVKAFRQLFLSSAEGEYLKTRCSDYGITVSESLGMSDELLQQLAVAIKTQQLTQHSILRILEIFFGVDTVRAFCETTLAEPFNLSEQLDLVWKLDSSAEFTVSFRSEDFSSITSATALEVATVLTKNMSDSGSDGYATPYTDQYGQTKVRIYSGSLGLSSSVEVLGGTAQPFLGFDTPINVYSGPVVALPWSVSLVDGNSVFELTLGGVVPPMVLSPVQEEDYVVVGTGLPIPNSTLKVLKVEDAWISLNYYQKFTVEGDVGFVGLFIQTLNSQLSFFRSTKCTTANGARSVTVSSTDVGVDVVFPATSQAITRSEATASYAMFASTPNPPPGMFLFYPTGGVAVSENRTQLTQGLMNGGTYRIIYVNNATSFPDNGWVVLGFGTKKQSQVIPYVSKVGTTGFLLEASLVPNTDYLVGTYIDGIINRGPYIPISGELDAFVVTGTAQGRIEAERIIRDVAAAGEPLSVNVVYPGDRGLGGEGYPVSGAKTSDVVKVFGE